MKLFLILLLAACGTSAAAEKPRAVIVVGTHHYSPHQSMPKFAAELDRLGFETTVINPDWDPEKDKRGLPGLEALEKADVGIFFVRSLKLEPDQLADITKFIESGKPVVCFRTSTHGFNYPKDHPNQALNMSFGRDTFGTPYLIHLQGKTQLKPAASAGDHAILTGVGKSEWTSPGTLYLTKLEPGAKPLILGTGRPKKAGVKTNPFGTHDLKSEMTDTVAWTWENQWGGRVFGTSLGHPGDFAVPESMRVMVNGVFWAAGQPVPTAGTEIQTLGKGTPDSASRPSKPNVVLILTDDLGWQDLACYDIDEPSPYETPNIDRLATEGIKFWQAYSPAPTCAPSRVAILSGKHPARAQKTHVVGGGPPTPYRENSALISPWYSGRMKTSEITIAEALKPNGYTTGAVGKWHCAINHHAFPQPIDQGFDFARMERGVTLPAKPHRLTGFATDAEGDPFRLDKDGFPFHQNTADALDFLAQHKGDPFFLYYATWLVHTPIHTRSEALLRKYCAKLGVPFPKDPKGWTLEGQQNPYYAAMVEMLDHYVGQLLDYLEQTDDPRWPGHKLVENTYIIFTSDNGGMEKHPGEVITDNYPLDKGKINAREGGVRVPLILKGPGIRAGAESDAMINGLDFYPTILGWTGTKKPEAQHLDGLDLNPFLRSDLSDSNLIAGADGKARDTMVWHFPHSSMQSTVRQGGFKLIRIWDSYLLPDRPALELFQLYDDKGKRVDIEEAKNLATSMPEKANALDQLLQTHLDEMQASPPFLNPTYSGKTKLVGQDKACEPLEAGREGKRVWLTYRENGAKVIAANLIYTDNGGHRYEEWYRAEAKLLGDNRVEARLPKGATHYVFNLIDENHFLVSHPQMKTQADRSEPYSTKALAVD